MTLNRMGYGAMQLAGPGVWGPPKDVSAAIAVLREAVESGVNHIDTSDYYGPHVTQSLYQAGAPSLCQGSRDRHQAPPFGAVSVRGARRRTRLCNSPGGSRQNTRDSLASTLDSSVP